MIWIVKKNSISNDLFSRQVWTAQGEWRGRMKWAKRKKKIRHKINSIQLAECSLLLADNISRWSLLRTERERVRFSSGVSNNGTLYPAPSAQPTSIHHHSYWKKTWGHLWRRTLEGPSKIQSTEYASSTFQCCDGFFVLLVRETWVAPLIVTSFILILLLTI